MAGNERQELRRVAVDALYAARDAGKMMDAAAEAVMEAVLGRLTPVDHCSWCGSVIDPETEGYQFALLKKGTTDGR